MDPQDARVLIIEDEKDTLRLYSMVLKKEGYHVEGVLSGKEGIDLLRNKDFDLVILDIMMPEMDGLQVAREIRTFSQIPILVISVKDDKLTIDAAKKLYSVVDYVVKPCSNERLKKTVKTALDVL